VQYTFLSLIIFTLWYVPLEIFVARDVAILYVYIYIANKFMIDMNLLVGI